jgi:hypothetical protein
MTKARRKPTGRPRTNGCGSTPRISFAVSEDLYKTLTAVAKALGLSVGQLAKSRVTNMVRP